MILHRFPCGAPNPTAGAVACAAPRGVLYGRLPERTLQLVTLYVTPVFYTYFDALPRWRRERWLALRGGKRRLAAE
jgi:hypothetical protein